MFIQNTKTWKGHISDKISTVYFKIQCGGLDLSPKQLTKFQGPRRYQDIAPKKGVTNEQADGRLTQKQYVPLTSSKQEA